MSIMPVDALNTPSFMQRITKLFLVLQILLFIVLTLLILVGYAEIVAGGGSLTIHPFENIMQSRLIATLAPYLGLFFSIAITCVAYRKGRYKVAILLPVVIVFGFLIIGQKYLNAHTDPIKENFGQRNAPYSGFLVLPENKIPSGFIEKSHHYTKREYLLTLTKISEGKSIDIGIIESDNALFLEPKTLPIKEFIYEDISGRVYLVNSIKGNAPYYYLFWYHPPKQRLSITLTQTIETSPDDLIKILESMKKM